MSDAFNNDNNSELFCNESFKKDEGIHYSNSFEGEMNKESLSQSNLSTPSYKTYFIDDEISKDSCSLADELCLKNIYILCENCNENYSFKFQNSKYITIKCGCKLIRNCLISKFITDYCSTHPSNYGYGCIYHIGEKTNKYCLTCQIDVCEKCLVEKAIFDNDSGIHTRHETHTLVDLLDVKKEIIEIKNNLIQDGKLKDDENIKRLLDNLIKEYNDFPTYTGYKTIKKILKKLPFKESKNEGLNLETLYIVKTLELLKEKIDNPKSIYKISINGEKTNEIMKDLYLFEKKEFKNLKALKLNNIKLKDISALSSCYFPNLVSLDLESNEITNDC